jgi:hypothetical protein
MVEQLGDGFYAISSIEELDDDLYRVTVNGKSVNLNRDQFERYREWVLNNADPIENDLWDLTAEQLQILKR